jgi:hypothetical protein
MPCEHFSDTTGHRLRLLYGITDLASSPPDDLTNRVDPVERLDHDHPHRIQVCSWCARTPRNCRH